MVGTDMRDTFKPGKLSQSMMELASQLGMWKIDGLVMLPSSLACTSASLQVFTSLPDVAFLSHAWASVLKHTNTPMLGSLKLAQQKQALQWVHTYNTPPRVDSRISDIISDGNFRGGVG